MCILRVEKGINMANKMYIRPITGQQMLQSGHHYHLERETGPKAKPAVQPNVSEITQILREQNPELSAQYKDDGKFTRTLFKNLKNQYSKGISHKDLAKNMITELCKEPKMAKAVKKLQMII